MTKTLIKYLSPFFILLLSGLSYMYAHSVDAYQSNECTEVYQIAELACVGPVYDEPMHMVGHGQSGRAYKERTKMISTENKEDLYKPIQQKKPATASYYFNTYGRISFPFSLVYGGISKLSLLLPSFSYPKYILLRMLRI